MTNEKAQQLANGLTPNMIEAVEWMVNKRSLETRLVNFSRWGRTMRGLKDRNLVIFEKENDCWRLNSDGRKVAEFVTHPATTTRHSSR